MPLRKSRVLTGLLMAATLLSAQAQKRSYQSFNAEVPFAFNIGDHKFHAGYYELLVVGPGLMVVRDAHAHVLTRLMTRELRPVESPAASRFVFEGKKGHLRLTSIWGENGKQGYEIVGEEVSARQYSPPPALVQIPIFRGPSALH